ncbi:laccase-4 isoform X1 [Neodiprion lecontei]|uniref:Laccase-4 isoform X1 n=2 Tax=Neodiprion lecontei TaxID=441921 RepID=A0A6J0BXG2_NEOLC|nr:laccase-4 isoform X1 [Neodiprion lecontei]
MWHLFHWAVWALFTAHGTRAFQSFRLAAMTRGFDFNNTDAEVLGGASHECYRTCVEGDVRTCVYSFTVLEYTTMSYLCDNCPYEIEDCYNTGCVTAGGHVREVILVNNLLPGPSIQVCEGDTVQVDLTNTLATKSTTIHWHGLHQVGSPYMDGTPYLTQCPILPHNTFQYNFTARPAGTHIWHSHSGFEEADGLYGSFIVRRANDSLAEYYDYDLAEHVMAVWHWYYEPTGSVLRSALHRSADVVGYSLTVNGLASTVEYEKDGVVYMTPRADFTVTQGYKYRFRLMYNSAVYCPIQVSIDNHTLLVIASEAGTFEPVEVDSLIINAGERYDFVLTADQSVDNYWIRYRGLGDCVSTSLSVTSEAILRYSGSNETANPSGTIDYDDGNRSGALLNPVQVANETYSNNSLIYLVDLNSTLERQPNVSGTPDNIIYLHYTYNYYYNFSWPGPYPQINGMTFEYPSIALLTQYNEITDDMYCTEEDDSAKECISGFCSCAFLYSVDTGSLVEIVIVDLGLDRFDDHPMHLHGHAFQVVAMEAIGENITVEEVISRNEAGLIDKKLDLAPVKDNIGVPAQGFAVLRFVANNPGFWFFHCHVSNHAEMGMGVVIKVGDYSEMIQPPDSFPKCRNWNMNSTTASSSSSSWYSIVHMSNGGRTMLGIHIFIFIFRYVDPLT